MEISDKELLEKTIGILSTLAEDVRNLWPRVKQLEAFAASQILGQASSIEIDKDAMGELTAFFTPEYWRRSVERAKIMRDERVKDEPKPEAEPIAPSLPEKNIGTLEALAEEMKSAWSRIQQLERSHV